MKNRHFFLIKKLGHQRFVCRSTFQEGVCVGVVYAIVRSQPFHKGTSKKQVAVFVDFYHQLTAEQQ